jgi:hypothetical protein
LRAGELVTLRLADLHIDVAQPSATVRYGTAPDLPTKTGRIRDIPVFHHSLNAVRVWIASMPTWLEKNPDKLVFPGTRGGFRSENHVIRWDDWKAILKLAGITRRFRWHDLRHTCASSLVSGFWGRRWSLEEVMGMLGHTDIKTTQRYAHLAPTALKQAGEETQRANLLVSAPALPTVPPVTSGSRGVASSTAPKLTILRKIGSEKVAPPAGFEPANLRFRKSLLGVSPTGTPEIHDPLVTCAGGVLVAAARQDSDAIARARELARGVLALQVVRLANGILDGGENAVDLAVTLAGVVIDAAGGADALPNRKDGVLKGGSK